MSKSACVLLPKNGKFCPYLCSVERDKPDDLQALGQGEQHNRCPSVTGALESMANNVINPAAEVAANVENKNNAVKVNAPKTERRREYTASKRHEIPALWKVLGKARPVFTVQISKTNEVKASCIQRFMPALYADENLFWIEFMKQVNILLDSRRFCRECKALGYQPENVAEHVVFLGSAPMRKVLREGVQNTLGASIQFYKERFSPVEADNYREGIEGQIAARPAKDEAAA